MKKTDIPKLMFMFYMALLLYVLIFAERNVHGLNGYNILLFAEIKRYIRYREILGKRLVVQNLLGNIIGFLPFGFFLPQINRQVNKMWKITLLSGVCSLTVEVVQLLTGVGCFEIDDVFLNTLGGWIGGLLGVVFSKIRKKYGKKKTTAKI